MQLKYPKNFRVPEGTVIAIPIESKGWVLGVYARIKKGRGRLSPFGYFFGKVFEAPPGPDVIPTLYAKDAILQSKFGDLGLVEGRWPIIGTITPWVREDWPMPEFMISAPKYGMPFDQRIVYDENDPSRELSREILAPGTLDLPDAGLPGSSALEFKLSAIISGERSPQNMLRKPPLH